MRPFSFDESSNKALQKYHWPGNIREVRNIIERAFIFFPNKKMGDDVENYLLQIRSDIVDRAEEQTLYGVEIDNLGFECNEKEADSVSNPPNPKDFATWFETNNSVDLRVLLRDIEIVLIEAC